MPVKSSPVKKNKFKKSKKAGSSFSRPDGSLSSVEVGLFRSKLLDWYDRNRREMPWRPKVGQTPDPYQVWLSEVMLQQTVVAAVVPYFTKFIQKWPTVQKLADANLDDVMNAWAGLGYYARARNLYKCAQVVSRELGGVFPSDESTLMKLSGIGAYTSAAIRSIAFNLPSTVVDGNVERVMARIFNITDPLPAVKLKLYNLAAALSAGRKDRPADYAQALMDLGATVCIPKAPRCGFCPVSDFCKSLRAGNSAELPRRNAKKLKPQKFGAIYWIENAKGRILLERRPPKGLLGGMTGFLTSTWHDEQASIEAEMHISEATKHKKVKIFHSFTHFDLTLQAYSLHNADKISCENLRHGKLFWVRREDLDITQMPTLFRKFARAMLKLRVGDNG